MVSAVVFVSSLNSIQNMLTVRTVITLNIMAVNLQIDIIKTNSKILCFELPKQRA